tara:strand:- start:5 stop:697 length:693 start_codon:yes stop_codon:yes gene_type:complete
MQAQDIMTRTVVSAPAEATVEDVTALMIENHISAVPIVDENGGILGLVSEGDLMRRVEGSQKGAKSWWLSFFTGSSETATDFVALRSRRAKDIMTRDVHTVAPDTPAGDIARLLEKKRIKRVPVVSDGKVVGIVARANLLHALASAPVITVDTLSSDRERREIVEAALARVPGLNPVHLNVVVEGGRVNVWGLAGSDAIENAARVALDNIEGLGPVSVNLGRVPDYAWGI